MIQNPILSLLHNRYKTGERGIYSCCSANEYVIRAAMRRAKITDTVVLVEATANQVNQNGGYTGMTPADFHLFLQKLADEEEIEMGRVLCGGDHLGPLTWKSLPASQAMENAEELIRAYVGAGFSKIHIDTSMKLADDSVGQALSAKTIARRCAQLCDVAEKAFDEYVRKHPDASPLVYVVGSEVPIPGGAQESESGVAVTSPGECEKTLEEFEDAFLAQGLADAWERVVAVVVQPGVEFSNDKVTEYNRQKAWDLMTCLQKYPKLVFEGHSTDYQPRKCLRQMAEDGVAILKVGPALTFALREGLFALEDIEKELYGVMDFPLSHFRAVLEQAMLEDQSMWDRYYHGTTAQKRYARAFGYSDRARYYLAGDKVRMAVETLLNNLDTIGIPMALLSQYLPIQHARVNGGKLPLRAADLVIDHVGDYIDDYLYAIQADR